MNRCTREYVGIVTNVVDGDTMDVEFDLGFNVRITQRLRLLDVDTPETFRPSCEAEREHGQRAKEFVIHHVLGKRCRILTQNDKKGKYGRYLAFVFPPDADTSINDLLIKNNLVKLDHYE